MQQQPNGYLYPPPMNGVLPPPPHGVLPPPPMFPRPPPGMLMGPPMGGFPPGVFPPHGMPMHFPPSFPPGAMPFPGGMPPRMPPQGFMPPPYPGMPPMAGQHSVSAPSVIVGAPTMRAGPPQMPVVTYSPLLYNPTNEFLNKYILNNPLATLPLTVFVGNIPYEFEDNKLAKIFECCGKVTNFIRPTDPTTSVPATIAFLTFQQSINAMRALNILNNFLVSKEGSDEEERIAVKVGKKEARTLEAVKRSEEEAATKLPENMKLDDVYGPIRAAIEKILTVDNSTSTTTDVIKRPTVVPNLKDDINNDDGENSRLINYYNFVAESKKNTDKESSSSSGNDASSSSGAGNNSDNTTNGNGVEGQSTDEDLTEKGEKMLYSEIEKYRQRQLERDRLLEQQRRDKIKEKIKDVQRRKKREQEQAAKAAADALLPKEPGEIIDTSNKRRGQGEDEQDSKRRKKDDSTAMGAVKSVIRMDLSGSKFGSKTTTVTAKTNTAAAGLNAYDEDDDDQPRRELIMLDYTEEELKQLQASYRDSGHEQDNEELEADNFTKNNNKANKIKQDSIEAKLAELSKNLGATTAGGANIPLSVHERVLAQARAISAALQGGSNAAALTTASSNNTTDVVKAAAAAMADAKESLKKLVDKIPTDPTELLAHPINWEVIDRSQVVEQHLRAWVVKKVVDYLGEEEESLTSFIVSKLHAHCTPQELQEELSMVLEDDSEQFILKLWRMLVYYSLKCSAGM